MKTLAVMAGLVVWVVLAHAENQRQIRLAAYAARLRVWQVRQEIAVRRYLAGESGAATVLEPPPAWQG
jgi:hypothetical protein